MTNTVEDILAIALPAVEALTAEVRRAVVKTTVKGIRRGWPHRQILDEVQEIVRSYEPGLANLFSDAVGSSWVGAVVDIVSRMPENAPVYRPGVWVAVGQDTAKNIKEAAARFPYLAKAAEQLAEMNVVSAAELKGLADGIEKEAFTFAQADTAEVASQVRDLVVDAIVNGTTYREFNAKVTNLLDKGPLSRTHIELLFRTTVQRTYADSRREYESTAVVHDVFPYKLYVATHDSRVRDNHEQLEKLGLNGTAVYRLDDPMWQFFEPPWAWNCRCGTVLLTIQDAAGMGVMEAKEWLKTGLPPSKPEHRLNFIPFRPDPNFIAA